VSLRPRRPVLAAVVCVTELGFDRAILSRVEDSQWLAQRVHIGGDADWADEILDAGAEPFLLDHLVDTEMVRRKASTVVHDVQDRPGVHKPIAGVSRSRSYAAAPLVVGEEVIGFLHADLYYQNRDPHELDRRLPARPTRANAGRRTRPGPGRPARHRTDPT
jgi:GAF domain-containing protein